MRDEIIAQGVELMLYGMGTVVIFLALLVVATAAMSRLLARYLPEVEPLPAPQRQGTGAASPEPDSHLVAAIAAALHRHRTRRN